MCKRIEGSIKIQIKGWRITAMQYTFLNNDDIEPLFKSKPPYVQADKGYMGVVLYKKSEDSVHCHLCGEYVKHLPSHVFNAHKIQPSAYRVKYGLPLSVPLVARKISEGLVKRNKEKNLTKHISKFKYKKGNDASKGKNNAKYARNCASFTNKFATCPAQIYNRYLIVAEIVERDPSEDDLEKHDSKLLWTIKERHGSINKFKSKYGFEEYKFKKKSDDIKNAMILKIKKDKIRQNLVKNPLLTENQKSALRSIAHIETEDLSEAQCQQIIDIDYSLAKKCSAS